MKKTFNFFCFLVCLTLTGRAQIPAGSNGTYTSISPVDNQKRAIPGIGVDQMITFNVKEIFHRKPIDSTGIDATFVYSQSNPDGELSYTGEPNPNFYNSIIIVKVYSFDRLKPGGKGPLIWGIYSTQTTSANIFKQAGWTTGRKVNGVLKPFSSNKIRFGIQSDSTYYQLNTPNCVPSKKQGWLAKAGTGYTQDCIYRKGNISIQPVIVEVTVKNATLRAIKFPRNTIVSAQYFPIENPPANSIVFVKGTNYEINTLTEGLQFGHFENRDSNFAPRFTLSDVNPSYLGAQFTGIYGSENSTNAYLKVNQVPNQEILVAYETGQTLTAGLLGSTGFTPTKVMDNAFSISDDFSGSNIIFSIWRVTSSVPMIYKFNSGLPGPFIIANAFDVNFRQNPSLPLAKRKLFNRGQFLNDVLVCAHRGLWNKTGQPGNGTNLPQQLNGIAENSIDAYQAALNNPDVDWIEFDARRTSDGVMVAFHDDYLWRVTNKFDDRECIPINEVNQRDRLYVDSQPTWKKKISQYTWAEIQNLQLRDYLGCKVKSNNGTGSYVNPLRLIDALQWARDKNTALSIDFKDGLYYLDELLKLVLINDLEGQVLFSVYAKDFSLAQYQTEYGMTFLRQIPLKPTFYEPTDIVGVSQYGGDLPQRLAEYVKAADSGYTISAITINVNNDKEPTLTSLIRQSNPPAYPADKIWYVSHYLEPYMVSIYDNLRVAATADCDPTQHPGVMSCVNLFWRGDFDWLLNNGTNGIFSDNPEPLIAFLKAKGKK